VLYKNNCIDLLKNRQISFGNPKIEAIVKIGIKMNEKIGTQIKEAMNGCRLTYLNQYNRNGAVVERTTKVERNILPLKIARVKTAIKESCNPGSKIE
jgi:hypothetical protein